MTDDTVIRAAAVVAAAALLAAPYRRQIVERLAQAAEAASRHRDTILRGAAACLLIAAAWGKVPLPTLALPQVQVRVDTPSREMQSLVADVATALKDLPAGDRLLWAQTWTKAGVVVSGDAIGTEVAFTDTRSLRAFTGLALDIAWRRIGQHVPGGNEPLRKAVEAAYGKMLGTAVVPVTAEIRARYVELADAIAWAGISKG